MPQRHSFYTSSNQNNFIQMWWINLKICFQIPWYNSPWIYTVHGAELPRTYSWLTVTPLHLQHSRFVGNSWELVGHSNEIGCSVRFMNSRENLALPWRHNGLDGVSNHQSQGCLLNRLFGHKKRQGSASQAFVCGIHRRQVNSRHKWPVTRRMSHLMTSSWERYINFIISTAPDVFEHPGTVVITYVSCISRFD